MVDNGRALTVQQSETPLDLVPTMVGSPVQAGERVKLLQDFIRSQMHEGEDYGKIPGTPKPTLLKPGAEKLLEIYGYAPGVDLLDGPHTWEDNETGHAQYTVRVTLTSKRSGILVAAGVGSCNTREKRFTLKTGGYRDPWTERNAALKMAKKRALVDATLSATRSSGLFTQDLEDQGDDEPRRPQQAPRPAPARPVPPPQNEYNQDPPPEPSRAQIEARWKKLQDYAWRILKLPETEIGVIESGDSNQVAIRKCKELTTLIETKTGQDIAEVVPWSKPQEVRAGS